MANIFRQAQELLREKPVLEMNDEERLIVNAATIPLDRFRVFDDIPIGEGLEELAKIVDGAEEL